MRRIILFAAAGVLLLTGAIAAQQAWGTANETYVNYGPPDFNASTGTGDFTRGVYLQPISGGNQFYLVPHLPTGAVLTSLAFEFCDSSVLNNHVHLVLGDCDFLSGPCGPFVLVDQLDTISNGCHIANSTISGYVVDNSSHRLFLQVYFDAVDPNLQFQGAILGYKLQVSPAPATPSFGDVPTNHPFFQFIEALYASGITGGCGAGNYCPDSPVTRGQMAVFLAKALGLNWPY